MHVRPSVQISCLCSYKTPCLDVAKNDGPLKRMLGRFFSVALFGQFARAIESCVNFWAIDNSSLAVRLRREKHQLFFQLVVFYPNKCKYQLPQGYSRSFV